MEKQKPLCPLCVLSDAIHDLSEISDNHQQWIADNPEVKGKGILLPSTLTYVVLRLSLLGQILEEELLQEELENESANLN